MSTSQQDQNEMLALCVAEALWGSGADKHDKDWAPDTLDAIADAVVFHRPDLYTKLTGEDPFE